MLTDDPTELKHFYEECYTPASFSEDGERYGRWRELSAQAKADHVVQLCKSAGIEPEAVLDVGCGDGVLLQTLAERGFGRRRVGFELSAAAVTLASGRPDIDRVEVFDGKQLPLADEAFDLAILSHVLEHVPEPAELLTEVARVCSHVVVEVPLEANISARRPEKRKHAAEIGHLHAFDRKAVDKLAASCGLEVVWAFSDPLPRSVHTFSASTGRERLRGSLKWFSRRALFTVPPLAEKLFTVHRACLLRCSNRR